MEKNKNNLKNNQIPAENLLLALIKCLQIMHKNNLDKEAILALKDFDIELEID